MQLRALRRHDWQQQYANAKILQKFAKVFANFCKFLEHLFHFILAYSTVALVPPMSTTDVWSGIT